MNVPELIAFLLMAAIVIVVGIRSIEPEME